MDRLSTGIAGLDDVLAGGLPTGQMYLLQGYPGTGKTTLAMQFMLAGLDAGETCLYITLSEPRNELIASAESHELDLTRVHIVEFVPDEASLAPKNLYTVFHPADVELNETINRLTAEIEKHHPDRLVIDSVSELRLLAADKMRYRRQLIALKQYLAHRSMTALLLDDCTTSDGDDLQLQSIAHGVIALTRAPRSFGVVRRQVEILKLRGSAFREGSHDYVIQKGGIAVFPRLVSAEHSDQFPPGQIKSGLLELDALVGGGLDRGSNVLLRGPTGVGKSSISMQYAVAAAGRGERTVLYSFDEAIRSAQLRAAGLGMDIEGVLASGHLRMAAVDPAEMSPGELIWQIRKEVEERSARFIVIDSLNGFLNAMPGEKDMLLHIHELFTYLAHRGVVSITILNQQGLIGSMQTVIDVSYLADTVLLLRYFEFQGKIHQVISALKKRIGDHEKTLRELTFSAAGIHVGAPLANFRGILTGVPEFLPQHDPSGEDAAGE